MFAMSDGTLTMGESWRISSHVCWSNFVAGHAKPAANDLPLYIAREDVYTIRISLSPVVWSGFKVRTATRLWTLRSLSKSFRPGPELWSRREVSLLSFFELIFGRIVGSLKLLWHYDVIDPVRGRVDIFFLIRPELSVDGGAPSEQVSRSRAPYMTAGFYFSALDRILSTGAFPCAENGVNDTRPSSPNVITPGSESLK
jgi:hypothetical protein